MEKWEFQHIYFLSGLILIPLCILLYMFMLRWKKRAISRFGDSDIIGKLLRDYSKSRPLFKFILLILAFTFLIFGLANLRVGSKIEKTTRRGIDIVIALDISNSMLAEDIKPSRLERSKMAISKLIDKLDQDQIGLVVFAGRAQMLLPITTDYAAAKLFLSGAQPDLIPMQGTAIGAAIDEAAISFNKLSRNNKAIIIISDGENHEDDAVAAAKRVSKDGVVIHSVGLGSPGGAPIPISRNGLQTEYKKGPDGSTVISKLNEPMLQQIAAAGKGTYVRATNADVGLDKIFEQISHIEKKEYEAVVYSDYEDLFPYFIAIALLLVALEVIIFERKTMLTRNLNIFKRKWEYQKSAKP